jgi:GNAT superfamily N-acetyltransferase
MIVDSIESIAADVGARTARHFDTAFRRMMSGPMAFATPRYLRFVTGEAHPMGNVAIVRSGDDASIAREATTPLLGCGAPSAVIFPDGVAPEVAAAVEDQGFTVRASMPAMAVDIDALAPTTLPPGYDWARIGRGDEGRAWAAALAEGYELPQPLADLFAPEALGADPAPDAAVQFFAVLREGRQVATSMLYLADGLAGIYCVSTLPGERNQGLGAHATAEALRAARRCGYRVGVLQSSPAGHSVYLGLGFGDYFQIPMRIRMPA